MTKDEFEFLRERLAQVSSPDRYSALDQDTEPPEVKKARKVIRQWQVQAEKSMIAKVRVFRKARIRVYELLHEGDYAHTLAAVKAFEKTYGES